MSIKKNPWASGPGEILNHGLQLLEKEDSDVNRRIAMISIDNSVELMIKTYLNLPRRISGISVSRKRYAEFSESFPKLIDALEEFASDKVSDLNFGEIEWYHRLRNELYHQGNGLTVERQKVETYAIMARILFKNLFGFDLIEDVTTTDKLDLSKYLEMWGRFEQIVQSKKVNYKPFSKSTIEILNELVESNLIEKEDLKIIDQYRLYRNKLVHSQINLDEIPVPELNSYMPFIMNIITKIQGFEIH